MSSKIPYVIPFHRGERFNCPHCNAFAGMIWFVPNDPTIRMVPPSGMEDTEIAKCSSCSKFSHWIRYEMVYPVIEITVDDPNEDLSDELKNDYMEAASILATSPRGAAALLRLAIQKLCDELVEGNKNLDVKIGVLVEKGLNPTIQQALDIVRVIGNESVHPGQIDLGDTPEIATQLFTYTNLIAEQMITIPNRIAVTYSSLPEAKREAIERRDKRAEK